MLIPYCMQGSFTSHGFKPIPSQTFVKEETRPFLRVGDGNWCPVCKRWSTIVNGDSSRLVDGKAAVLNHAFMSCGAILYAMPSIIVRRIDVDALQPFQGSSMLPVGAVYQRDQNNEPFNDKLILRDDNGEVLAGVNYVVLLADGTEFTGKTDEQGQTQKLPDQAIKQTVKVFVKINHERF